MILGRQIDVDRLPMYFPTHQHKPEFWESLGRAIATFGFLEWSLRRAIFALTGAHPAPAKNTKEAVEEWTKNLKPLLSDTLGNLVPKFDRAYKAHPDAILHDFDGLIMRLKTAKSIRDVFAHAHWPLPNDEGKVVPVFVNRKALIFDSHVDKLWLDQTQKGTSELACAVISSVTALGIEFPGS